MILKRKSILSGKVRELEIDITEQQYLDFQNDKLGLIQNAFPHLSRDEREFMISGIHPDEWDEIFESSNN